MTLEISEYFNEYKVSPLETNVLMPGQNIPLLKGETSRNSTIWECWNEGFKMLDIEGLEYEDCQLIASYHQYAWRGDTTKPKISRSQSVLSHWRVDPAISEKFRIGTNTRLITAYFPVYDGIGFWISKRRREQGVTYYSEEFEHNLGRISAEGALRLNDPQALPQSKETVYRCVWIPGKMYNEEGLLIPSLSTSIFRSLGMEPYEMAKETPEATRYFKLFGKTIHADEQGNISEIPFSPDLAIALQPAWKFINSLPYSGNDPDPESY